MKTNTRGFRVADGLLLLLVLLPLVCGMVLKVLFTKAPPTPHPSQSEA